jgi:TfoX/Sxy family transcriptional regulator of competence genes
MGYDPELAARIRAVLSERNDVVEKKMFGGIAFMVKGNMACGPHERNLIVRIGDAATAQAMKEPHVKPMNFTGRVMKNFATIEPEGIQTEAQLRKWVEMSAEHAASLATQKSKSNKPRGRSKKPKS